MNKVILTGNLCRDIELKYTQSGKAVLSNCVAVQRDFKNANNEYESDFINITVWGGTAEYLAKYGNKGDRVELVGYWRVDTTENNGQMQTYNKCEVEQIKVFSKPKDEKEKPEEKPRMVEIDDNQLPF